MKKYLLIISIFALTSFHSYSQQEKHNSIKAAAWLVGSWEGTYNNAPFYEAWRKFNDSILVNFSIEIKGKDTIIKENGVIRLLPNGKMVNAGPDASWAVSELTNDRIVLVNDTLKYANKITWEHSKEDHWLTEIQNPTGKLHYDMVRVNWLEATVDRFIARRGR
jgi:hypothetical protein